MHSPAIIAGPYGSRELRLRVAQSTATDATAPTIVVANHA